MRHQRPLAEFFILIHHKNGSRERRIEKKKNLTKLNYD